MEFSQSTESGCGYLVVEEGKVEKTHIIETYDNVLINIDLDEDGEVLGIEVCYLDQGEG